MVESIMTWKAPKEEVIHMLTLRLKANLKLKQNAYNEWSENFNGEKGSNDVGCLMLGTTETSA
jgi:hypothetical protein